MSADLIDLVQRLGEPNILVVGDVMLDRYVWGNAERISQEAPVILLRADKREERLGGASSVAMMLRALGARVSLAGVVGGDRDGSQLRQLLNDQHIDCEALVCDPTRPTTVKERFIGRAQQKHPQQMLRVDYETCEAIPGPVELTMTALIESKLGQCELVLISDYDKGVCTPIFLGKLVDAAKKRGVRVLADPIRRGDYTKYRGCSAITPNRLEAGTAAGTVTSSVDAAVAVARQLREALDLEAAIVTLDKDGMVLAHRDGRQRLFPTRPRQVYDITGAGDMVLSVLGMALAAGADYDAAIRLANIAGGLEVERIGVAPITREEILADLLRSPSSIKLCDLQTLNGELEGRRRGGQRIAFTNGCFDLLHAGHVQYLEEARQQADCLVVGLNSDASVRGLKGSGRPLNSVETRAYVLAAMQSVDYVVVFDEPSPLRLIETIRPDVLVKGADYTRDRVVGGDLVESYGGRVHLAGFRQGFSTTGLLKKIEAA
jgi:D-beta-D-heptose 7-phosphate kinase / D-beta-D-heptose 1-phosphate adenosyltransferase